MTEYTEKLESYNRALREVGRRPTAYEILAMIPPGVHTLFVWLQEDIAKELNAIEDYLSGKQDYLEYDEPKKNIRIEKGVIYSSSLRYFQFPESFNEEIKSLVEGNEEEFSDIELAWVKDTKELISKYHAMFYKREYDSKEGAA